MANGPNDYSVISKPIFDLTNGVLRDPSFDPTIPHSPLQQHFESPATPYTANTPFEPACPLFVNVPSYWTISDGYIDNIMTIVLDTKDWVQRGVSAAPLVIYSLF